MAEKGNARYTDEEKRAALRLAAKIGTNPAARELGIYGKTIRRFREQMPEYWSELLASPDAAPRRKERQAQSLEDLADAYTEREFEALQRAESLIKTADAKGLAALMRAMGASRGLATVGARAARGEDTQVVEHNINFAALERAAEAILSRASQPELPVHVENLAETEDA